MRRIVIRGLVILTIAICSLLAIAQAIFITEFSSGIPVGLAALLAYAIIFSTVVMGHRLFIDHIGSKGIMLTVGAVLFLGVVPKVAISSFIFFLSILPIVVSLLLGMWCGYLKEIFPMQKRCSSNF